MTVYIHEVRYSRLKVKDGGWETGKETKRGKYKGN